MIKHMEKKGKKYDGEDSENETSLMSLDELKVRELIRKPYQKHYPVITPALELFVDAMDYVLNPVVNAVMYSLDYCVKRGWIKTEKSAHRKKHPAVISDADS